MRFIIALSLFSENKFGIGMIFNVHNTEYESDISEIRKLILGQGKKACIITFGCQQNEADGEKMAGMLSSMGYLLSDNCDECDIILVNTCAIREHAEAKALSLLGRFKSTSEITRSSSSSL